LNLVLNPSRKDEPLGIQKESREKGVSKGGGSTTRCEKEEEYIFSTIFLCRRMHKYNKGAFLGRITAELTFYFNKTAPRVTHSPSAPGQGAYGVVHKATPKDSNRELAIKKIRMGNMPEAGVPFVGLREIKLLRELKHPNVIQVGSTLLLTFQGEYSLTLPFCPIAR